MANLKRPGSTLLTMALLSVTFVSVTQIATETPVAADPSTACARARDQWHIPSELPELASLDICDFILDVSPLPYADSVRRLRKTSFPSCRAFIEEMGSSERWAEFDRGSVFPGVSVPDSPISVDRATGQTTWRSELVLAGDKQSRYRASYDASSWVLDVSSATWPNQTSLERLKLGVAEEALREHEQTHASIEKSLQQRFLDRPPFEFTITTDLKNLDLDDPKDLEKFLKKAQKDAEKELANRYRPEAIDLFAEYSTVQNFFDSIENTTSFRRATLRPFWPFGDPCEPALEVVSLAGPELETEVGSVSSFDFELRALIDEGQVSNPVEWSVTGLPFGMSAEPSAGPTVSIGGTPTIAGTYPLTISAIDASDENATLRVQLTVNGEGLVARGGLVSVFREQNMSVSPGIDRCSFYLDESNLSWQGEALGVLKESRLVDTGPGDTPCPFVPEIQAEGEVDGSPDFSFSSALSDSFTVATYPNPRRDELGLPSCSMSIESSVDWSVTQTGAASAELQFDASASTDITDTIHGPEEDGCFSITNKVQAVGIQTFDPPESGAKVTVNITSCEGDIDSNSAIFSVGSGGFGGNKMCVPGTYEFVMNERFTIIFRLLFSNGTRSASMSASVTIERDLGPIS